ncbi:MAG: prepilin-type N-terminal cleavage/methylation domain-containing protein [Anaerolineae bacterium]|nr:prepilin-type N-terminal cleavage/methylation domain-containing protein [Anaerolineae bacterium]
MFNVTRVKRSQRGFTLLELMLVLAISALITSGLAMTLYQLSHLTVKGQSELKAQHQLQNVASWLNRDVVSASPSQAIVGSTTLTLTLPYYTVGKDEMASYRTIGYSYSEEDHTLTRTQDGASQVIGREIGFISFGPAGTVTDTLSITVTVSFRGIERTSALRFDLRLDTAYWE